MLPLGLIAIPLPIASDAKTGTLTEVRATVSPSSGLTIVSALAGVFSAGAATDC